MALVDAETRTDPTIEKFLFQDDGTFPNNAGLYAFVYRGVLGPAELDPVSAFRARFSANVWVPAWVSGLFGFHHYHSTAHEALGVCSGRGRVCLGGPKHGRVVSLSRGDVVVIPAGVAHREEGSEGDFALVGAYPRGQRQDMKYGRPGERPAADRNIRNTPLPAHDPVLGSGGPLVAAWGA